MNKVKDALYYAIRTGSLGNPVIAVTTEKASGRWYGRNCLHNEGTHGTRSDLSGRFATQAEAEAKRDAISTIAGCYDAQRMELSRQINKLYAQERAEILQLLEGKDNADTQSG